MSLTLDPNNVWRDYATDGVPASGEHSPRKVEIRRLLSEHQQALIALIADAGGGLSLPNLLIRYTVTGGTANNITATPNLTPPTGPGLALFSVQIIEPNTESVFINGKPLLTSTGNQIPDGGLQPGIYLFLDNGENFRLISDASMQAINEAIRDQTIDARDIAVLAADQASADRDFIENHLIAYVTDDDQSVRVVVATTMVAGQGASPYPFVSLTLVTP